MENFDYKIMATLTENKDGPVINPKATKVHDMMGTPSMALACEQPNEL